MEIREANVHANRNAYANTCVYIKQIESINLVQLYRALAGYVSFLTLPEAEHYLNAFGEHLVDPYSWLSKAQTLAQAEEQRESAKTYAQAAGSALDQVLWEDSAKKLNYIIESWDADVYSACQQMVHGISMLINEHIPLNEVQAEIIEFAAGRSIFPPVLTPEESVTQKLERLLCDAKVNSASVLVKLARTVAVQAELFLNRLMQTGVSFDQFDARQSFLFEANYKLCEFIETQSQHLKTSLHIFPEKIAKRIAMRLNRVEVDAVLQRYEDCALPSITQVDVDEVATETQNEPIQQEAPPISSQPNFTHEKLEAMLVASEQLLATVIKQVALHRLQLSCSSRVKACYSKFSLFPLFRQIADKLTYSHTVLANSLAELTTMLEKADIVEQLKQRLSTVINALENGLERIKIYLNTLNVRHEDYSVTDEIPNWQTKLHDLILGSSEEELAIVDSRLQRIEGMNSPYLRATLIMKLDLAKLKLNDMIIANMQSWSSRLVDRETVENTLSYLGIRIHPSHLNKIAPNIHIPKKRSHIKKDFYSTAADYGITAWKNVRAWLDKQAIN